MTFDINGEFGYELFTALPLVNWYKEQGHDIVVNGAVGAKLLYPNIKVNEIYNHREPFLRVDIDGKSYYKQHNHVAGVFSKPVVGDKLMWEDKWSPPNLKEHYKSMYDLEFEKPLLIISNKYQEEWGQDPINYINLDSLKIIFELCKDKFQIIYNRPSGGNITNDNTPQKFYPDWNLAEDMGITLMQTLQKEYNLDYNTTQMVLMSYCSHHISTQGGNSALAAYFGGENIIYAVKGYEVKHKSYETFFPKLSGQKIHHVQTYDELIKKVKSYVN